MIESGTTRRFLLAVWLIACIGVTVARAQEVPQVVDIFWNESKTVQIPGVTRVLVLDESISNAEVSGDRVTFSGLTRGETVAFAWVGDDRLTLRLRITARPVKVSPLVAGPSANALDMLGSGVFGTSFQLAASPNGDIGTFLTHHLDWRQLRDGNWFTLRLQTQNNTAEGTPAFNVNSATMSYETPKRKISLLDFPVEINGGTEARVSLYSGYNVYPIRGVSVKQRSGINQYELFGGATIPSYFGSLRGTREIAGMNFTRKESSTLLLYGTLGWVNAPISGLLSNAKRENSFFGTSGFSYRPNGQWAVQGTAGASTRGVLAQGTVSYNGRRLTTFLTGTRSSPDFPLNQLQLLFTGGSSINAGATLKATSRLTGSLFVQHSQSGASIFSPVNATSSYYSSNLSYNVTRRQSITVNQTFSRNFLGPLQAGTTAPPMVNQRLDLSYHTVLGERISNTAQFTMNSLADSAHLNSDNELLFRDTVNLPIGRVGSLSFDFQHVRRDPELTTLLNQDISLLSPELQQLFTSNPAAFVQSGELPLNVRTLLENLKPSDTQFTVSGQFHAGKLNISPTAGFAKNAVGATGDSSTQLWGYSMSYQISPTLQMTSAFSNDYFFDPAKQALERTTVMNVGIQKSFSGVPHWLDPLVSQKASVRGRVFRDLNLDGVSNPGEPGLAGIRVELGHGQTAVTDSDGNFVFSGLKPDFYVVRLAVNQFGQAVRLTGPAEVHVDLIENRSPHVDFGVVNFARLTGNVFNDYLMDGFRQPDANGLRAIKMKLSGNGVTRDLVTDGSGDYGVNDIVPGDYELLLDRATLPANFQAPEGALHIHIEPVTTVVEDVPVRALRSISGHVYVKPKDVEIAGSGSGLEPQPSVPEPLAGVQLRIGESTSTTGTDGSFVLRNLPSGELMFNIIPARRLPEGLSAPAGKVKLPREPIQVEGATIVISNPELLQYLVEN